MSYLQNAGVFLIQTIFGFIVVMFVVRALLILIAAPFTDPLCRFVYQFTNPVVMPLRNVIPRWRRIDFSSLLVAWFIAAIELALLVATVGARLSVAGLVAHALVDVLDWIILIEIAAILVVCVMSFVPSMRYGSNFSLLLRFTDPVVRPFRRFIPTLGGMDFSYWFASVALILVRLLVVAPLTDMASRL